jgi:hypothetical protein
MYSNINPSMYSFPLNNTLFWIHLWDKKPPVFLSVPRCKKVRNWDDEYNVKAMYIVACTAVAKQRLRYRRINNGRVWATARLTRSRAKDYARNNKITVFSVWSVPRRYNQGSWSNEVSWALQGRLRRNGTMSWQFSCVVLTSGQQHDYRRWRISVVKIRYQETTSESRLRILCV